MKLIDLLLVVAVCVAVFALWTVAPVAGLFGVSAGLAGAWWALGEGDAK